jgi:hypothetical protein
MIHMKLLKYSFGTGDRFAHQGLAQLKASIMAREAGVELCHVWNKSYREHKTVNSHPADVKAEAEQAVKTLGWKGAYMIDADHINLSNVDMFLPHSDFFTIDVADYIGRKADQQSIDKTMKRFATYAGELEIPGIATPFRVDEQFLRSVSERFLLACQEAGNIYRHIANQKGADHFVPEVSMDEVEEPQSPAELFFILGMLAEEGVPAQTIAPKFTGRFNKGVDYVGNIQQFSEEFENDLLVIQQAIKAFGLPENLKLSVHSGSDKFSIYKPIRELTRKHDAGVHVKTAGTTWLEELIGLSLAGGSGLEIAKAVYGDALKRYDELTAPYSTVIDVDVSALPSEKEVGTWSGEQYANALRHVPGHPEYNPHFRQLLHCGYKVAANMGAPFFDALKAYESIIAEQVTENIYERHIKPLFID